MAVSSARESEFKLFRLPKKSQQNTEAAEMTHKDDDTQRYEERNNVNAKGSFALMLHQGIYVLMKH